MNNELENMQKLQLTNQNHVFQRISIFTIKCICLWNKEFYLNCIIGFGFEQKVSVIFILFLISFSVKNNPGMLFVIVIYWCVL